MQILPLRCSVRSGAQRSSQALGVRPSSRRCLSSQCLPVYRQIKSCIGNPQVDSIQPIENQQAFVHLDIQRDRLAFKPDNHSQHGDITVRATTACLRARLSAAANPSRDRQGANAQLLMTLCLESVDC